MTSTLSMRRSHRMVEEIRALNEYMDRVERFSWQTNGRQLRFEYTGVPGLVRVNNEIQLWTEWSATVAIGPRYPLQPPEVSLRPKRSPGTPWHSNVLPSPPFPVCYGHHLPVALLDQLARRIERIIVMEPGSVMVDERDALNPRVCALSRRLIREGYTPLRTGAPLPDWCCKRHLSEANG